MYDIIPLILIVFSIFVIIFIIVKKIPEIISINVDTIANEQINKAKQKIINQRLIRLRQEYLSKFMRLIEPIIIFVKKNWDKFYYKVLEKIDDIKRSRENNIKLTNEEKITTISQLLNDGQSLIKEEKYSEAEKKIIKAIAYDSKNINAYKSLGQLYFTTKQYNLAEETYKHLIKLLEEGKLSRDNLKQSNLQINEDLDNVNSQISSYYIDLALIEKAREDYKNAISYAKKAIEIEPLNPRYLDILIELAIIIEDKSLAIRSLDKLKQTDPKNQKISQLEDKISEI